MILLKLVLTVRIEMKKVIAIGVGLVVVLTLSGCELNLGKLAPVGITNHDITINGGVVCENDTIKHVEKLNKESTGWLVNIGGNKIVIDCVSGYSPEKNNYESVLGGTSDKKFYNISHDDWSL